jgi:hypothetical protein
VKRSWPDFPAVLGRDYSEGWRVQGESRSDRFLSSLTHTSLALREPSASPADQFTYQAAPTVTGVGPTFGPAGGGTLVAITGTSFTWATAVDFGKAVATNVTEVSAATITAQSPAGTGTVDVTVSAFGETSSTSAADVFTYTADGPQVTSVARYPSLLD